MLLRTRGELQPLVTALHDLFFPPASSFMAGPSAPPSTQTTGSFYRTNVSADEFLDTLASWYAPTAITELPQLTHDLCTRSQVVKTKDLHTSQGLSVLQ